MAAIGLMTAFALYRWNGRVFAWIKAVSLYCTPFLAWTLVLATVKALNSSPPSVEGPTSTPASVRVGSAHRVVWIIFDELEQRIGLEHPDSQERISEFIKLQSEAFCATNAFPPSDSTMLSMPALITGQLVRAARTVGFDDLVLHFAGSDEETTLKAAPTIFKRASSAGLNCAVVGWYHPYHRLFRGFVETCHFEPFPPYGYLEGDTFRTALFRQIVDAVFPLAGRLLHATVHDQLMVHALEAVSRPDLDLILLHLSVPHPPYIFKSALDFLNPKTFRSSSGYVRNLELANKDLGLLREEMTRSGLWGRTTVIVSSDHWWRESARYDGVVDKRVPFIVKLASENRHVIYPRSFNAVSTQGLIFSILQGEVTTAEEISAWIEESGTVAAPLISSNSDHGM
ncbi:MAG: hypothetical protein AB9869_26825 [Verrucomicrobiia bacterium]